MPLRPQDLENHGLPELPATRLHREAKENLVERLLQIAKIGNGPLPVEARMTAHWILGFTYNALASFHYPSLGPRSQSLLEGLKWWIGRLRDPVAPDRETMIRLADSAVSTVVELVVFTAKDGSEHAFVHYHPLLTLEQAAGLLRCYLGYRLTDAAA